MPAPWLIGSAVTGSIDGEANTSHPPAFSAITTPTALSGADGNSFDAFSVWP